MFTQVRKKYYGFCYILFAALRLESLALRYCLLGARIGNHESQNELGLKLLKGIGVDQDRVKAVYWFQESATLGNQYAQLNLGAAYHGGVGVIQDFEKAKYWYQKSADQNCGAALFNLGTMYENGQGFEKDFNKAVSFYKEASACGMPEAKEALQEIET